MRYLEDRPVVLTRYPDGIHGKSFFQKDAPAFTPDWVRTARVWSEHAQREIDYFVCDRVETLLYLANLGTIPLHVWASRVRTPQRPDWCILDLDPKAAPFEHVVTLARAVRELCEEMELEPFVKTSGASGLHVLIPLGRQLGYEQSRSLGELMARVVCERLPELATTTRAVGARGGRVYVDYLQNGHGRLLAGPFSVRPLPGGTVSTPLWWREVRSGLDPARFNLRTVPDRLERNKEDPMASILEGVPDLARALARLEELLSTPRDP
jgi:bifunctional non-homologous end joining protein LigD